jgi:hypothetical protein
MLANIPVGSVSDLSGFVAEHKACDATFYTILEHVSPCGL